LYNYVVVEADELSRTFAALADPTRRSIVERLAHGALTVNELAEPFALTQQAISKHLKVLERAGLVVRTRVGPARPCALDPEHLDAAMGWISEHRRIWADRYDRLERHLARLVQAPEPVPSEPEPEPEPGTAGEA
jgi:DNA-binding transcriptional ArsR family regulator